MEKVQIRKSKDEEFIQILYFGIINIDGITQVVPIFWLSHAKTHAKRAVSPGIGVLE